MLFRKNFDTYLCKKFDLQIAFIVIKLSDIFLLYYVYSCMGYRAPQCECIVCMWHYMAHTAGAFNFLVFDYQQ